MYSKKIISTFFQHGRQTARRRHPFVIVLLLLLSFCAKENEVPVPALHITSLSPTHGPAGTRVTVAGSGFSTMPLSNVVTFNGTPATVTSATENQLVATVPATATSGVVNVTVDGREATGPVFTVEAVLGPGPVVTNITPRAGPVGTQVIIAGSGFDTNASQNAVTFNGTTATITQASATELKTTVPTGATTGNLVVTTGGKNSAGMLFTVTPTLSITSFAPTSGGAGTKVTLQGLGFNITLAANVVKFSGVVATVVSATPTMLEVIVPNGATTGQLTVAIDGTVAEGGIFIVNSTTGRITVSTVAGDGLINTLRPAGLAFNVNGDLLIADQINHRIMKYNSSGLSLYAGSGVRAQTGPVDGPFASAQFNGPTGISVDRATGFVYVAEQMNNVIRKIDPTVVPTMVSTWAGFSNGTPGTNNGSGAGLPNSAAAGFFFPTGIVKSINFDAWFVTDYMTHVIRRIDASAQVTTFAGEASQGGSADGQGSAARFNYPSALAVDNSNNLYVGDCFNGTIRKIDLDGNVTTFATGVGFVYGLAWDGKESLYATSFTQHVIYKIDLAGNKTIIAGSMEGYADGDGSTATFSEPYGIVVDKDGNLLVSDQNNGRIRKITFH
ncbi:IPT/TIG domain-containing protein [Chryseolinea lacunae]|uniref:IPT/TIG domain-containing protein n=1 Tax=Chryseolinea lacunae TaxID=2801331 RepID=A0ABS1KSP0_9BACT|nr:IPT/TIG domain-containing protein [Chryseolinea lacunae]MBL0742480.1 IPT/TIG domain-containing protein [Chryseolinea lacunae]